MASIQSLQVGRTVHCPEDRGNPAYWGVVTSFSRDIHINTRAIPYVWVTVAYTIHGISSVWPSHRLGFTIDPDTAEKGHL